MLIVCVLHLLKRVLLEELWDATSKLERQTASHLPEFIYEVVDTVEAAENVEVKVDWIDRVIGRISNARGHHKLVQIVSSKRERTEGMKKQSGALTEG